MKKKIGDLTINEAFELHQKNCKNISCDKCSIRNCNFVICDLFLNINGEGMPKEYLDQEIEVEE